MPTNKGEQSKMRNARRQCLGTASLAALGLALPPAVANVPVQLHVVGSEDPPYRIFAGGRPRGLYFDLLRAAAERAGWLLQIEAVPPARALQMLQRGSADAMVGPLRTPERERYLHYSRITLPPEDKAFYTRRQVAPLRQLDNLPGLLIGVQRGKRYGHPFDEDSRLRRVEVSEYRSALTMVELSRLDAAVVPERQGDRIVRQLGLRLIKQPLRLPGETPYLVLSRRSRWLSRLPELERAFEALQRDGAWAAILQRY